MVPHSSKSSSSDSRDSPERLKELNRSLEQTIAQRTQSLRLSQAELRDLIESVNDSIFTTDRAGRILFANQATFQMLGYTPEELIGQRFTKFLAPGFRAFGDRVKEAARRKDSQLYAEVQVVHADGTTRWIGQNVRFKYEEGFLRTVQVVGRDITAAREFDDTLRSSEEKYRGIIENMELGLLEVDMHGIVIRAYDKFCEMLGYTAEELIGQDSAELFLASDDVEGMKKRIESRAAGVGGLYEVSVLTKSGEEKHLLISAAPVFDSQGVVIGSIGIHYDVSDRKENERALIRARREALSARDAEKDFLAKMSHEIRTPMNAVIGMAHLLKDTELSEEQREFTESILHAAGLLQGLLNSVLDLSKLEEGRIRCEYRVADLRNTLLEVYDSLRFILRQKGVTVSLDIDEKLPRSLKFDRGIVSQILLNLGSNAVKFTYSGSIVISARWKPGVKGDSPRVVLQVTDTGIGIASDQLGFIFDRFHQVDQGVDFESGSTGLGLSIVSELAEIHGGRATVVSEVGKGSTFEVELLVHLANNEVLAKSPSTIGSSSEFKGVRVLVAEDNPFNARYATRLMQRWGADYEVVENGELAFELYKSNRWDVVLMDVQMPACDGLESTRLIRSFEASQATSGKPKKAAVIIGLSAFDLEHDIIAAMDAGMNTHIRKPYTPGDLSKVMRQSLKDLPPAPMPKSKSKSKKRREDHPVYTMCEGDEALWLEFVEVFKKGWPKIRQEIQAALEAGDASMQHLSLHKVKPSLAMVDLQQAYKRSIDLESRAKAGENLPPDEVALLVDEVDIWTDE